jgi:hypothetical protein
MGCGPPNPSIQKAVSVARRSFIPCSRALAAALLVQALALCPRGADAEDKRRAACFTSSEEAQLLRNDGKLRAARQQLRVCAADPCPAQMRKDCAKWLGEVEATLATVVIEAHDASGRELTSLHVTFDGERLVDRLDGRPIEVDPGERSFAFSTEDGRSTEQHVIVHAGDRAKKIVVILPSAAPPDVPSPEPSSAGASPAPLPSDPEPATVASSATPAPVPSSRARPSLGTYLLGGLAVATGGVGAYLAVTGLNRENNLRGTCAPRCNHGDVSGLSRQYLAADILFGVATISAGAALWLFFADAKTPAQPSSGRLALSLSLGGVGMTGRF